MLNNYTYIENNLVDVTATISKDNISINNIINRDIMQKNLTVDKYYNEKSAVRNGNATYHLSYEFIFNDNIYQLTVLDNHMTSSWTTLDDWEGLNMFVVDDKDIEYIINSMNYTIFHIPIEWFYDEDNRDHMCEMEMRKIRPLIRKAKIKKLLK